MTAVEFLKSKLPSLFEHDNGFYEGIFKQAMEKEKEQIIDAFISGIEIPDIEYTDGRTLLITPHNPELNAEQYYAETFSNKGN